MHELSIAANIVDIIEESTKSYPTGLVNSVTIQLGTHSGVDPEALRFCFPIACEKTKAKNAKLVLEIMPLKVNCHDCLKQDQETESLQCPLCHSTNIHVVSGKDMIVASIDLDVE